MTIIRKLALVLCLGLLCSKYSEAQTTYLNMGDDGYGSINLNFAFPFYDRTFSTAYMYDNGIVSFLQPNTQGALPPWQWSAQSISQTQAKYFIAGLWADIAPVSQTRYIVDQTSTTAKFTWSNIAEYYSKWDYSPRLNTFSVQLDADGTIAAKYNSINLRTSSISFGIKGDADYTQIGYGSCCPTVNYIHEWTLTTVQPKPPTPAPATQDIVATIIEAPVQTIQEPTQTTSVVSTTVTPTTTPATVASPVAVATQAAPVAEQTKTTESKKTAVKAQQVDMSVVDAAVSVALTSAQQSVNEQTTSTNVQTFQSSVSLFNRPAAGAIALQKPQTDTTDYAQQSSVNSDKKDAMDTVILDMIQKQEFRQDQKDKSVNKSASTTTDLGPPIPGFTAYATLVLPDAAFYAPKMVYRNQRVVDNTRLLRSLSNDARFERMIDQQYQR